MNTLRAWVRLLFSVLTLLLLTVFMLRIFSPGNPETAYIFQKLQWVQPRLDQVCAVLVAPVSWVLEKVNPFFPAAWKAWFPISPAGAFFSKVSQWALTLPGLMTTPAGKQLHAANYGLLFPGVVDWRLLLALPFWGFVESWLLKLLIYLEAWLYRLHVRQRDAQLLKGGSHLPMSGPFPMNEPGLRSADREDTQDFLTGLYSQSYFEYRLGQEMQVARMNQELLALLLIEIDDFQERVEANGPALGDFMLSRVAPVMQVHPPQGEAISCRYGDHQFGILLTAPSPQTAEQIAEWIREQVAQIQLEMAPQLRLSVSIGAYTVCFTPANGSQELTEATFIAKADAQKYIAQRKGKNQVSAAALL